MANLAKEAGKKAFEASQISESVKRAMDRIHNRINQKSAWAEGALDFKIKLSFREVTQVLNLLHKEGFEAYVTVGRFLEGEPGHKKFDEFNNDGEDSLQSYDKYDNSCTVFHISWGYVYPWYYLTPDRKKWLAVLSWTTVCFVALCAIKHLEDWGAPEWLYENASVIDSNFLAIIFLLVFSLNFRSEWLKNLALERQAGLRKDE